ncbi:MAG: AraC family transcriptional regulator [Tyzzerella sp.]|nr:AraC family transcriptional regulator [Tyzzerella sp.]
MLYHIEMRKFAFTAQRIDKLLPRPHIHPHLEMIYVKKGHSIATLDNRQYELEAGDIFLAFPNQLHFYHDIEATEGYLIIFAPEIFAEFKEVFQSKIPETPIWKSAVLPVDVQDFLEKLTQRLETGAAIDQIAAKGYLLTLMAEMFSQKELIDKPGDEETIKKLLTYCLENYTQPLTLESLAKELYLNKYYISHIFRERMNISYKDFITQLRVEHACKLLKKNVSVTETAYASGFSSTKTFNRVFLKYMKMSPRGYAKSNIFS